MMFYLFVANANECKMIETTPFSEWDKIIWNQTRCAMANPGYLKNLLTGIESGIQSEGLSE